MEATTSTSTTTTTQSTVEATTSTSTSTTTMESNSSSNNSLSWRLRLAQVLVLATTLSALTLLLYQMLILESTVVARSWHPAAAVSLFLAALHVFIWTHGSLLILQQEQQHQQQPRDSSHLLQLLLQQQQSQPQQQQIDQPQPFLASSHPWTFQVLNASFQDNQEGQQQQQHYYQWQAWYRTLQVLQVGLLVLLYACAVDTQATLRRLLPSLAALFIVLGAGTTIAHANARVCSLDWWNCPLTAVTYKLSCAASSGPCMVIMMDGDAPASKPSSNKCAADSTTTTLTWMRMLQVVVAALLWTAALVWTLYTMFFHSAGGSLTHVILYLTATLVLGLLRGVVPATRRLGSLQRQAADLDECCAILQNSRLGLDALQVLVWMIILSALAVKASPSSSGMLLVWVGALVAHATSLTVAAMVTAAPVTTLQGCGGTLAFLLSRRLLPSRPVLYVLATLHQLAWSYQINQVYLGKDHLLLPGEEEQERQDGDVESPPPPPRRSSCLHIDNYPAPLAQGDILLPDEEDNHSYYYYSSSSRTAAGSTTPFEVHAF